MLTIGNFDGVHRAHQELLRTSCVLARQAQAPAVVLTFEPHPLTVVAPDKAPARLTTLEDKLAYIESTGIDLTVVARSEPDLLTLEAVAFIEEVVVRLFHPAHIVEGPSFGFGRGRKGTPALLQAEAGRFGYEMHVAEPVMVDLSGVERAMVSSSLVRDLLRQGRVEEAARCLTRPYSMVGPVIRGHALGRRIGFPTANLGLTEQVIPADGVYAGRATAAGQSYPCAINVGFAPTFGVQETRVEAHLLDFDADLYGKPIRLEFLRRLRAQEKFVSAAALAKQLHADVATVRELFASTVSMTAPLTKMFDDAAALVCGWRRPLLMTHEKPDGDALGSLAATSALLRSQGVQPTALLFDLIPDRYALLNESDFSVLGRDCKLDELSRCDGIVVLDTCTYSQLRPVAEWLRAAPQAKLAIDHHLTRDDLAKAYVFDESAAATCLILFEWAKHAGWQIDAQTARALFVGLAMDTGWFHHSNTDARALAAAAELLRLGARPHILYESLFQQDSAPRVRLLGAALGSLELLSEGQLALMTLDRGAFASVGATPADTEDIINEPLRIAGVRVSALLVEAGDGVIRVSLRSRATESGDDVDVSAVAQFLGGGGHRHAAGAKVSGTLRGVRELLLSRLSGNL